MKRGATALLLVFFASVSPAQAAYDPLGGGSAKLTLDKRFSSFLKANGIALTATAPAKRRASAFTLPVSGGILDPTIGKGEIETEGTLLFQGAKRRVPLRQIRVKTKRSPLVAKVGGSQLKVASSARLSAKREGFGSSFQAKALKLTAKVATRLNKKLRPELPFHAGQPLGTLIAKPKPRLVTISALNRATLLFDAAFAAKLDSLFVALNPIFPAEHIGPSFTMPIIAGGAIAPDASQGTLRSGGDVEALQLGSAQLFWHEIWLDLTTKTITAEVEVLPTPAFPGKLGRIGVFDVSVPSVSQDPGARSISVSGAALTLRAQTAQMLNEAFLQGGPAAFAAGEVVGALSFVAQGQ